jgi:F420-non-reducing hydrogenase iron-sulfur subunit
MSDFEPKIVVFLCNWCSYAGADLAGVSRYQYPTNIRAVRVMCSTRISAHIVLELFKEGVDGVMVSGCHIGDCHYINGNLFTERRVKLAEELLKLSGVEPERLRLEWVSAAEGERYSQVITSFVNKVKELGPTPVSKDKKLVTRMGAAVDAAKSFRSKTLTSKEVKLTGKGNVYEEVLDPKKYDLIIERAIEDEYQMSLILALSDSKARSVKELATETGQPTDLVLNHVVALRAKNLLALDHIEGTTPKYRATIGGA